MQNCKCDVCSGLKSVIKKMEIIDNHKETYSDMVYLQLTESLSKLYRELTQAGCNNDESNKECNWGHSDSEWDNSDYESESNSEYVEVYVSDEDDYHRHGLVPYVESDNE